MTKRSTRPARRPAANPGGAARRRWLTQALATGLALPAWQQAAVAGPAAPSAGAATAASGPATPASSPATAATDGSTRPASAATGVPGIDLPPPPQPPRPVQLPPMGMHRLANGLTVVTVPRRTLPVVTATLLLRAGADADPPGRPGVAAMTATLLPKGARRGGRAVPATELARQAEALGSALSVDSGWGSTVVTMSVATPQLEPALALMTDVLRRPLLAADELERARAQALDGLRVALGSPAEVAGMALRRAWWGDSAYGGVVTPAALQRLARADVQAFHARHARPERVALVLAGDIAPEHAARLAQRLLGDWTAGSADEPPPRPVAPQLLDAPLVLVDMPGSGQSGVVVAAPFVGTRSADRRIGAVANAVLGGGYSARVNQAVRIRRGLSYGAFTELELHPASGTLLARAQTAHATAAEVLALLRAEITRLADEPPAADELAARQATLVGSFARRLQSTGGLAGLAVGQLVAGRPLDELQRYVPEVLAVTPAQVQAFARTHWAPDRLRAVVAGDLSAAGEALAAAAQPQALRLSMATLDLERPGLQAGPR